MTASIANTNHSFTAICIAWAICLAPHAYALVSYELYIKAQSREVKDKYPLQRHQPRSTFLQAIEANPKIPRAYKERLQRAHAASLNGYENLGFFAAAVIAANLALLAKDERSGETLRRTNLLSFAYCASRIAYCVAHTLGVSGPHRGIYFYTGIGICIYLCQQGGRAMTEFART